MTLALALGWKYDNAPGIETVDGVLTAWPEALGDAPDETEQAAIIAEYAAFLALPPDPYLNNGGLIRFAANPVIVAENIRFAGASRLVRGRFRATHLTPYPNDQYSATPSVKDPNRCAIQVTNRTATFVEVRVWDAAGALYDPQEITITTERVVTP